MNFKKSATIAATVAALGAISVPAMALENEFHGMYRVRGIMSNFENAGILDVKGGVKTGSFNSITGLPEVKTSTAVTALQKDAPTATLFEQRARLQYTAKANADLKLVTHFEIDSSWGDQSYGTGRSVGGGGIGADQVNLETKNVYLDFNCPLSGANVKVGVQPFTDAYKGTFITADLAGIFVSKKVGQFTGTAGFSRFYDYAGANPLGRYTEDLYLLDAKFAVSKDVTVGGAYYLVRDNDKISRSDSRDIHVVGANATVKAGTITTDAFFAYQAGSELLSSTTGRDLSAFAGQLALKANLDKAGAFHANALYTSGGKSTDNDAKAWQSIGGGSTHATAENAYYDGKMLLLMRSAYNMDTDKALVFTTNNKNHGVTLLAAGYDANISDKFTANANVGYAMFSKKDTATDRAIGTELNAALNYKLFSNLTATLEGAYVMLGDGVKYATADGRKADNPYLTEIMFNFTF